MSTPTILCRQQAEANIEQEYSLAPDAAVVLMTDGSARILDMGDRFYSVPPVASMFLQETLRHGATAAIDRVSAEYDVPKTQAETDLKRFLDGLVERGILWQREGIPTRKVRRSRATALAAGMLSRTVRALPSLNARAAALLTAVKLSLKWSGWTQTVSAWRQHFPIRQVQLSSHEAETQARAIDDAVCSAAAWNPLGVACKERAMACWALARSAGLPAALVIGIELYPLTGHCWCEAGSRIVSDHADNCAKYIPALRYQ